MFFIALQIYTGKGINMVFYLSQTMIFFKPGVLKITKKQAIEEKITSNRECLKSVAKIVQGNYLYKGLHKTSSIINSWMLTLVLKLPRLQFVNITAWAS